MRISDWSSDVCSSDLIADFGYQSDRRRLQIVASFRNNLVQIIGLERTTILPIPTRKNQRGGKPPSRIDEEQRRSRKIRHCPGPKIGRASCRERVCQYG